MKIFIRVDASIETGTGHVMRCLTLAERLKEKGAHVVFISRGEDGNLIGFVKARGYENHSLPPGIDMAEDARLTAEILSGREADWLIADHYAVDISWEKKLRPLVKKTMVIDDLADRGHDCDILLDQNYFPEGRYRGLVPDGCIRLIGPKYALLRPQFPRERERLGERSGEVRRILVFISGTDPSNATSRALNAIKLLDRPNISADAVIGSSCPHIEEIKAFVSAMPNTALHVDVEDMAGLMAKADLAIGAGGTATWERCSLGLPSLVITIAENQVNITEKLAEDGYIIYAGRNDKVNDASLSEDLRFLIRHPEILRQLSQRCLALVDGRGAEKVANRILKTPATIRLRPARPEDSGMVFEWRNHPDVRRYFFDPAPLSADGHEKWFMNAISSSEIALLIAEGESGAFGVLRYNFKGDEALVSVYLNPSFFGAGLGARILTEGNKWLTENRPGIKKVKAEIIKENSSSLKAFEAAGFNLSYLTFISDLSKNIL